jgi:hypothetical protein
MQTHEHDLSITSFVFSGFISVQAPSLLTKGVAAESSPRKLAAKFSVI